MIREIAVHVVEFHIVLDQVVAIRVGRHSAYHVVLDYQQNTRLYARYGSASARVERVGAGAAFDADHLDGGIGKPVVGGTAARVVGEVVA
jgi:hypothetical protein